MPPPVRLAPGTLAEAIAQRALRALREGALQPIPTRMQVIEDGGIGFVVRVAAALARRRDAAERQRAAGIDPFLPYEASLHVADLTDAYACLLNKYNVVDRHVLLVTRKFEEQQSPLGPADFAALWIGLVETDGLGFYNAGAVAGASQRHKHLQIVPLPLGRAEGFPPGPAEGFPLAASLDALAPERGVAIPSDLPFPAALARIGPIGDGPADDAGPALAELYREMLRRTGVDPARTPYNLLATRRWLWLVPRSRPDWRGIPVNALGFAGALLVPDEDALARLRAVGPLALLRAVTPGSERV